jgi:hypothetical protein
MWVGRSVGRWHRHRLEKKDDEYVRRWKLAWSAGRDARWAGIPREAAPHLRRGQRDAWLAGWLWASTQPDVPDGHRPNSDAPRPIRVTERAGSPTSSSEEPPREDLGGPG